MKLTQAQFTVVVVVITVKIHSLSILISSQTVLCYYIQHSSPRDNKEHLVLPSGEVARAFVVLDTGAIEILSQNFSMRALRVQSCSFLETACNFLCKTTLNSNYAVNLISMLIGFASVLSNFKACHGVFSLLYKGMHIGDGLFRVCLNNLKNFALSQFNYSLQFRCFCLLKFLQDIIVQHISLIASLLLLSQFKIASLA